MIQEDNVKKYYSLSFNYEFKTGKNLIFFAHSIPYTYSMLNEYLEKSQKKRFLLCYSLAGNRCEYLNL